MAGEMLADGQSPMMMTVDQYNERVARTWALAIEAEQERIIKLLEGQLQFNYPPDEDTWPPEMDEPIFQYVTNLIALIKGEK